MLIATRHLAGLDGSGVSSAIITGDSVIAHRHRLASREHYTSVKSLPEWAEEASPPKGERLHDLLREIGLVAVFDLAQHPGAPSLGMANGRADVSV